MYQEINDFVLTYGKDVYAFCCHLTRNQTEADDLYQETFLKAMEKREVILEIMHSDDTLSMVNANSVKCYLIGVAANLWKNKQRKRIRHDRIAPMDDREDSILDAVSNRGNPEQDLMKKELHEQVRKLVGQLPDKMRLVVNMYYVVDMSTEEIAQNLHIPAASVRSRLSKARKRIRKELEASGYEGEY